jgi:hypothetical protein
MRKRTHTHTHTHTRTRTHARTHARTCTHTHAQKRARAPTWAAWFELGRSSRLRCRGSSTPAHPAACLLPRLSHCPRPMPLAMPHARFWLATVPSARGHALSLNASRARTDSAARRAHQLCSRIGPGLQLTLCAHRSKGRWFSDLRAATRYAESAGRCRAPLAAERRVLRPPQSTH